MRRGLTLVELLLALTVFSVVMAIAGGLLHAALRSHASWGDVARPYQQMARAFARLEQDLESAQPFFGIPFRGTDSALEFARVEPVPGDAAEPAMEWVRVSYRLEGGPAGLSLVRETSPWRQPEDGAGPPRRETLLPLASGRFAFGALDAQGHLIWTSAWNSPARAVARLLRFDGAIPLGDGQSPSAFSRAVRNPAGILPPEEE